MTNYPVSWRLSDLLNQDKKDIKVMSTFSCGGGSTMGYKLSGCDVVGCVEIDDKMMDIYKANHNPRHSFRMSIQDFNELKKEELPNELYDLDILDGSPPCSVFSMAGKREAKWGGEHYFREGQEVQKLDDLFFHYIDTVGKLKPKIAIAENVKGLISGNARGYVKEIMLAFREKGYDVQLFLLNAAKMSVPQARERVFFIARRKDLELPDLKLEFNDQQRNYFDAVQGINDFGERKKIAKSLLPLWRNTKAGESISKAHPKGHYFGWCKVNPNVPSPTVIANRDTHIKWDEPYYLTDKELIRLQTFPDDFNFRDFNAQYVTGMSVPPYMIRRLSGEIIRQWHLG